MPSFKTEGKSKEDLAQIAQIFGLLSAEETKKLTKVQLVKILEKENRKSEKAAKETIKQSVGLTETAEVKKAPRTKKSAPAAADEISDVMASPEILPKKKGRPPVKKAPAEILPEISSEPVEEVADKPAVKRLAGRPAAKKIAIRDDETAAIDISPLTIETDEPVIAKTIANELVESAPQDAAADLSPEGAEAAIEKDSADSRQNAVRKPPLHAPAGNKPVQRRTTRIIVGVPDDQPTGTANTQNDRMSQSDRTGQQRGNRLTGRQSRQIQPSAAVRAANQAEADYVAHAVHMPMRSDNGDVLNDEDDEVRATNMPTPAEQDQAAGAEPHPAVEAGDVQSGILEVVPDGYGFLRKENYLQGNKDIYVPPQYIRRFGLRPGDHVTGPVKLQRENDRFQALLYIKEVNGLPPEKMLRRPHFDRLTPIYPDDRFILETIRNELSTRIIDLVAPIGKGQRGMIVSPPKAGKTILLQKIANAISINNPEVKLIVLLIDERPEEVTDMQRSINGEVVYSTFDKMPENHTKVTELVLERAMRLVELKHDVVILLDSMTRLARAYNLSINPTGRTLSGGLDPGALYGPKRFFGAARNIENGGSLTIIATSLIETGSRMDEVIFEEFKGTGNMEVYLDRKMSEKRIFPAIDINKSGTRREELLMTSKELDAVWTIRKAFGQLDTTAVTEAIINLLLKTTNNEHFISSVNVSFNDKNVFEAMRGVKPSDTSQSAARGGTYGGYNSSGYNSRYRRTNNNDED